MTGGVTPQHRLVLASGSPYRGALLQRLGLDFQAAAPRVDETAHPEEAPARLAQRLAVSKARAVAAEHPDAWIIGSDQVASCEGMLLGKPGQREHARGQLRLCSGRTVGFHTGLCLLGPDGSLQQHMDETQVRFRRLGEVDIQSYLDREPALDCAGSFKVEGLGISLFDAVDSRDPTALVGLPLIGLCRLLREAGFRIP